MTFQLIFEEVEIKSEIKRLRAIQEPCTVLYTYEKPLNLISLKMLQYTGSKVCAIQLCNFSEAVLNSGNGLEGLTSGGDEQAV